MRRKFRGLTSWDAVEPIYRRFQDLAWDRSHANWMTYLDLNFRLPELLLMRVDKMSMAVALEGRVPFLDHKFVELVLSIPTDIKVKKNRQKYILKRAVQGLIPDWVINRRKQGFWVPIHEWFLDRLGPDGGKVVDEFCKETGFFDSAVCASHFSQVKDTRSAMKAWTLLNLALWWKEYIKGDKSGL
ncbi:asparagine synthase-related protein [Thermodesulfobacteriota bacterium]